MSLGWILAWDRFYAYLHDVTSPKGLQVNLEHTGSFRIVFIYRAVLNSLYQSAKRSISSVKQRAAFHTVGGLDYRRRTVSEDRRGSVATFKCRQVCRRASVVRSQVAKSKRLSMNWICQRRSSPATHQLGPYGS